MTLAALIQKGGLERFATATPATSATHGAQGVGTVATVATVAVANPPSAETATARRWQVQYPGLPTMEVLFTPAAGRLEVQAVYPSATLEPLPDPPSRAATTAEAYELGVLIGKVLADATDTDRSEALAIACADPVAALMSFRLLAADLHPEAAPEPDDRRTCRQCACLSPNGRCLAAARGELPYVAARNYSPAQDVPKRCEGYQPTTADCDRRPGAERWPGLSDPSSRSTYLHQ